LINTQKVGSLGSAFFNGGKSFFRGFAFFAIL
jgi:hypothetical protein